MTTPLPVQPEIHTMPCNDASCDRCAPLHEAKRHAVEAQRQRDLTVAIERLTSAVDTLRLALTPPDRILDTRCPECERWRLGRIGVDRCQCPNGVRAVGSP